MITEEDTLMITNAPFYAPVDDFERQLVVHDSFKQPVECITLDFI